MHSAISSTPLSRLLRIRLSLLLAVDSAVKSLQELLPVITFAVAAIAAVGLYRHYLDIAPLRWNSVSHDRNAHYLSGLRMATDIRHGDLPRLARDFDANSRTWGPLHSVILATALTIGGPDQRLAILPSLAAWVGTIVLGFLLARRMAPSYGNVAGLAAAIFLFVSPAHRAYAADVMLESLGACMTLAALYAYARWVQEGSRRTSVGLAVVLTALALTKYNYWILVMLALGTGELFRRPYELTEFLATTWRTVDFRCWIRNQCRRPLNYVLIGLIGTMAAVWVSGGGTVHVAGVRMRMTSNMNLLTATFAVLLVRAVRWWRAGGREWVAENLGHQGLALVRYHVAPLSIWMLLPQHLYWFMRFSSMANVGEKGGATGGWPSAFDFYRHGVVGDYHLSFIATVVACILATIAVLVCVRRTAVSRGSLAIGIFALLSAFLLLSHPNQKYRFLHTWLPVVWVATGIGFAWSIEMMGRLRVPSLGPIVAATGLLALCAFQQEGLASPGRASERGLHDLSGSWRVVTNSYLPELAGSRHVGVFSNMPVKFLAAWSYIEQYGRADCLEIDLREVGNYAPATREGFDRWIAKTTCDAVVYIDVKPDSPYAEPFPSETNEVIGTMLPAQSVFKQVRRIELPAFGCVVTVWKK